MHLIPAFSFFIKSGFVSGSTSLFISTNQNASSYKTSRSKIVSAFLQPEIKCVDRF